MLINKIKKTLISIKKAHAFLFILAFFVLNNYNLLAVINVPADDTLAGAITTANGAPQLINITAATTTLAAPLPAITASYTIEGNSNTLDGANAHRGFIILGGSAAPTIQNITITLTLAKGGNGGNSFQDDGGSGGGGLGAGAAIYVGDSATATLDNITYTTNNATGGNAGTVGVAGASGGGGGGGLGGNGANGTGDDGTGGGGAIEGDNATGATGGGTSPYKGGDGATAPSTNATPADYGSGGGGAANTASTTAASAGGFGGGGGAGGGSLGNQSAANGGFGAGGGGGGVASGAGGTSVFGGGAGAAGGATTAGQGGGGAALGGAIFIDDTSTATIKDSTYDFTTVNTLTAGTGNGSPTTAGNHIFLATGGTLKIDTNGTFTVTQNIEADSLLTTGGVEVLDSVGAGGIVDFSGRSNTFGGTFTLTEGTVKFNSTGTPFGNATGITFALGSVTKVLDGLTGGDITLSEPITMTGPGTIQKTDGGGLDKFLALTSAITGASTITIKGTGSVQPTVSSPSFTGGWNIDGGILRTQTATPLGPGTENIQITNSGTFRFWEANLVIPNPFVISGSATIDFRSGRIHTTTGGISGTGALTFTQYNFSSATGDLHLNAANTFSGTVSILRGTIHSKVAASLSNPSSITLTSPGVLQIDNVSQTINDLSGTGNLILNQPIANTLTLTQDSGPLTLSGVISGTGSLEKTGASTLTLNTAETYTGDTTISAGILELANSVANVIATSNSVTINGGSLDIKTSTSADQSIKTLSGSGGGIDLNEWTLTINQNATGTFSGIITDTSGTGSIIKAGTSTLTLGGANNYSGTTAISAGTLALSATGSISSPAVTLSGTGALQIAVGAGSKTINNFSGSGGSSLILSQLPANNLTLDQTTDLIFSGTITGTGSFEKAGANKLTLDSISASTFTGNTTISAGTLELNSSSADLIATSNSVTINGGSLDIKTISSSNQSIKTLSGSGAIDLNEFTLTVNQNAIGTFSGIITDTTGTGSIIKEETSTLTLGGANTYSGTTTINAGTLALASAGSIAFSSAVTLSGTGALQIDAGSKTINNFSGSGATGSSLILNQLIGSTLSLDQTSPLTFSGTISGTGSLEKLGVSTLILNSGSPYIFTGDTTITNGTLELNSAADLIATSDSVIINNPGILNIPGTIGDKTIKNLSGTGVGSITLNNNNLTINQSLSTTFEGIISSSGGGITLTGGGGGVLTFKGANSYTGPTIITTENLTLGTGGTIANSSSVTVNGTLTHDQTTIQKSINNLSGSGAIVLNAAGSDLKIEQTSPGTFSGIISGTGKIIKAGANILTFSGNNTYTNGTEITLGTLSVSSDVNLSSGLTELSGGTLQATETMTLSNALTISTVSSKAIDVVPNKILTLSGTRIVSADVSKTGTGTLSIEGITGSGTGATTIAAGTMLMKSLSQWTCTAFNIASGATLSGTGTVKATVTNSGNFLPGASIGTLNIIGNYIENATLEIEITSTPNDSDKVIVIGTASLNTISSTLNIVPLSATEFFQKGTEYVIITATGGVSGTFGTVTNTDPLLSLNVIYEANRVLLVVPQDVLILPIASITNPNAKAVAKYLISCDSTNSDFTSILTSIVSLDLENLTDALLQISPARFGALQLTNYTNDQTISKILTDRLRKFYRCNNDCKYKKNVPCIKPKTFEVWIEPFSYFTHQRNLEDQRSFKNKIFGGILGADYNFSNKINFGGALGYSFADINWRNNLGDADIHSVYGSLYASHYKRFGFINASITGTGNFYETKRKLRFTNIDRTAKGNHKGFDITTHLGVGFDLLMKNNYFFQPTLDVDYTYIWQDGFQEKGANSLNLIVDTSNFSRVRGVALLNFIKDIKLKNVCISPAIKTGYSYENELSTAKITSRLDSVSCTQKKFTVQAFRESHSKAILGANFTITKNSGFTFYGNYQFEIGKKFHQHLGSARFEWNF